ncbi:hypothetical protein D3C73_1340970 [compost metagenome]
MHFRTLPVAYDDFILLLQTGIDEPIFTVSMGSLIQVHEVHIDGGPRNALIVLGSQMEQRLLQQLGSTNPHFCWGEGVHPGDDSSYLVAIVDFFHDRRNLICADSQILQYKWIRQ